LRGVRELRCEVEGEWLASMVGWGGEGIGLKGMRLVDAFRKVCDVYDLSGVLILNDDLVYEGMRRREAEKVVGEWRERGSGFKGGMSFDWVEGEFYYRLGEGYFMVLRGDRLREEEVMGALMRWLGGLGVVEGEIRVRLPGEGGEVFWLITRDSEMRRLIGILDRVKDLDYSVLLEGETGVGKELLARYIHYEGNRSGGPFVALNCSSIPSSLLESELFGYEKGAYTGAVGGQVGWLEKADGGTIFLDEIGDMPLELQAKLLRFLEDRVVVRVGSRKGRRVDVRVVSATNRDLGEAIRLGQFRKDLYYRLSVVRLRVPSLVERPEDLEVLVDYFMGKYGDGVRLGSGVMDVLRAYDWPGNVRELENVIRRVVVEVGDGVVRVEDLPEELRVRGGSGIWRRAIEETEERLIREAMEEVGYVKKRAAERLGISYPTFLKKLRQYGLEDLDKEKK